MWQKNNCEISKNFAIGFILAVAILSLGFLVSQFVSVSFPVFPGFPRISINVPSLPPITTLPVTPKVEGVDKFASEEDFRAYLQKSELGYSAYLGGTRTGQPGWTDVGLLPSPLEGKGAGIGGGGEPDRISTTTVQVPGIDEPDIVKTDGKEIYFSSRDYYIGPMPRWEEYLPPETGKTKAIKAFPPADLSIDKEIDKAGDLLLRNNILMIFSDEKIYGYNVSNPKTPEKKWTIELNNNNYVVGARLYQEKVYLIVANSIDTYHPCPIKPLSVEGAALEIKCADIYHPIVAVPVDTTYSAMIVNPDSGKVENTISFVGTSGLSVLYMSENAIYITYSYYESVIKFYTNFLKEKCGDIIPAWLIGKLEKLNGYDISDTSKMTEFGILLDQFMASLSDDEKLKIENELKNRMDNYYKDHIRELEKTGLVKIGLNEFKVLATGNVPGQPLNQFSLDEYKNHLRIATTIGGGWGLIGGLGESTNDVYVLDDNLNITGSVKNLGKEERIYSVRFIEDKGYVVTFKQIDPFFVLDLSNPDRPELTGELKIPGYSSYLHPITKDKILGIGKEGSNVKISLFNVEQPQNPTEVSKYTLDEYWSDILDTHHAFLLDEKHEVFFLPGSKGGYIFSYKNNELGLTRAVSKTMAKRAIYINDYLYIIGEDKITVLNEIDWNEVNELEL